MEEPFEITTRATQINAELSIGNHTGYRQVKGRKTTSEEILELYSGLVQSNLTDFDVLLSGYIPSAAGVSAVGKIGRELRFKTTTKPGRFFWALDPVMGDDGRLYIPEDEVPAYKALLPEADLILPNQFEAELLSGVEITNLESLAQAVAALHATYRVAHVVVTSLRLHPRTGRTLPVTTDAPELGPDEQEMLTCVGSSMMQDGRPRLFRIDVPAFPVFFSGTGDMFAALMVARLRAEAMAAGIQGTRGWRSPDEVSATELPLAKAAEKVLASMQVVLGRTYDAMKGIDFDAEASGLGEGEEDRAGTELKQHLARTKAAEVKVVKNVEVLKTPPQEELQRLKATEIVIEGGVSAPTQKADEHGVVKLGADGEGAMHVDNDKRWGPGP